MEGGGIQPILDCLPTLRLLYLSLLLLLFVYSSLLFSRWLPFSILTHRFLSLLSFSSQPLPMDASIPSLSSTLLSLSYDPHSFSSLRIVNRLLGSTFPPSISLLYESSLSIESYDCTIPVIITVWFDDIITHSFPFFHSLKVQLYVFHFFIF